MKVLGFWSFVAQEHLVFVAQFRFRVTYLVVRLDEGLNQGGGCEIKLFSNKLVIMSDEEVTAFIQRIMGEEPREERYYEETQQILNYIEGRGDKTIGELFFSTVINSERFIEYKEKKDLSDSEAFVESLVDMEAPELLDELESLS